MKNLYSEISVTLPLSPLRRFYRLILGERQVMGKLYLYGIIAGLIGLSLPLGIQAIINLVSTGALATSWYMLVLMIVVGLLVAGILQILQLSIVESMQQRIFLKSALELAIRIPRLDQFALRRHYVPELVNRFFDTVTVQKGLSKLLLDFSGASLQIVFSLILLSFYNPVFLMFGMGLILTLIVIVRFTAPMGLRTSLKESRFKYEMAHWLEEMGRNREVFKGKNALAYSLQRTDDSVVNYLKARQNHFRVLLSKYSLLLVFKVLIIAGLLIIGSILVVGNQLNLGQFVAVEIVTILLISSVEKLVLSVETIYDVLTALEKIGFITDMPLEKERKPNAGADQLPLHIRFEDFALFFPDQPSPELEALNIEIAPGERVLLEGGDPQRWHWLIRTLAGDFDQYSGKFSLGGIPARAWNKDELRARVATFHGVHKLIDGSVRENMTLHAAEVPMERLMEVSRSLGLDAYIETEPDAWDKQAGPEGSYLPYPIRAKVMLAQLLLSRPGIMVLSDFQHAVDRETRIMFWNYMEKELPETTVILMTMRETEGVKFDKRLRMTGNTIESL